MLLFEGLEEGFRESRQGQGDVHGRRAASYKGEQGFQIGADMPSALRRRLKYYRPYCLTSQPCILPLYSKTTEDPPKDLVRDLQEKAKKEMPLRLLSAAKAQRESILSSADASEEQVGGGLNHRCSIFSERCSAATIALLLSHLLSQPALAAPPPTMPLCIPFAFASSFSLASLSSSQSEFDILLGRAQRLEDRADKEKEVRKEEAAAAEKRFGFGAH